MLVLTRTHTRLTPNIPFFRQLVTDPISWNTMSIYKSLKDKMKLYEPRYTEDVLTKIVIWEFADQETFDTYIKEANVKKRDLVLKAYNRRNNISCTDSLVTMTDEEFTAYTAEIVGKTLPSICFQINVVQTDNVDQRLTEVNKPDDDQLTLDPWFEYL